MDDNAQEVLEAILDQIDWEKADKGAFLELLTATDENDRPVHFYFLVKPSRYLDYKYNVANYIPFDLNEYGTVLEEGSGFLPAVEMQEKMEDILGFDHADLEKIEELLTRQGKELMSDVEKIA